MADTLTLPLTLDGRGHFARAAGSAGLAARVGLLLETLPGDVEMAPELGSECRLRRYEPGDALLAADLRADTAEAIARWEPGLQLRDVEVSTAGHDTTVVARFRSRFTGESDVARARL